MYDSMHEPLTELIKIKVDILLKGCSTCILLDESLDYQVTVRVPVHAVDTDVEAPRQLMQWPNVTEGRVVECVDDAVVAL
jgi:hypothetical protein